MKLKTWHYVVAAAAAGAFLYSRGYFRGEVTAAAPPGKRPDDYRYFYRPAGGETMARPANEFTASEVRTLLASGWREAGSFTEAHKGAAS